MLSLFLTGAGPAHSRCDLQERRLDPPGGRRYIPHRSERLEGREERPDEAPEPTGGGDTERMGTVRPGKPARQRGRKVPKPGLDSRGRGGSRDPIRQPDRDDRKIVPSGVRRPRTRAGREAGTRTTERRAVARPAGEPQGRRRCSGRRETLRAPAVRTLSDRNETSPGALEPEGPRRSKRFGAKSPEVSRALLCAAHERRRCAGPDQTCGRRGATA